MFELPDIDKKLSPDEAAKIIEENMRRTQKFHHRNVNIILAIKICILVYGTLISIYMNEFYVLLLYVLAGIGAIIAWWHVNATYNRVVETANAILRVTGKENVSFPKYKYVNILVAFVFVYAAIIAFYIVLQ